MTASGAEVQWAVEATKTLGAGTRVVSVPCMERFDRQPAAYQAEVIGIDRFGISAPGNTVFKELGITAEAVVAAAK